MGLAWLITLPITGMLAAVIFELWQVADMTRKRWFLPETPDVLGLLREQLAVTIEGVDAFVAWAGATRLPREVLRDAEHRGDAAKRALLDALRAAFVTPLEPEDVFALSRGIDWILDYARDLVSESEVMACAPDAVIAEMAGLARGGSSRHRPGACPPRPPTKTRRPTPPMRRSRPSEDSSMPTTTVWEPCSKSRTAANGSPGESFTAAAPGSARW